MNENSHCASSTKLESEDYARFFNCMAQNRKPSLLRELNDIYMKSNKDHIIPFAGGFPNPTLFPVAGVNVTLKDGSIIQLDQQKMQVAQQYNSSYGYPPLRKKISDLLLEHHNPPCWDSSLVYVTCGSQDGISRCLQMLLSPGDYAIVEKPTYCAGLWIMNPFQPKYVEVEVDDHGMIPAQLRESLRQWDPSEIRQKLTGVPKFIYLVPSSANPSGVSISHARKREIYKIAQEYNLLILEDDPYYFLQFDDIENRPPSFLSMDVDGRVIRFDSFSKIISSGFRVGFATGPAPLIQKMVQHAEVTIIHTATLSQMIICEMMDVWGKDGFAEHVRKIREFYQAQRNNMVAAAKDHLKGLCEWNVPVGGMFLWAKLIGIKDTMDMIMVRGAKKGVLLLPGKVCMADDTQPCPYVRMSYSISSPETMQEGCRRLAELIIEERERDENKSLNENNNISR